MSADTIEIRVARGAALLDAARPWWWQESAPDPYAPIELDRLDLGSCENCIIAQVTGECYEDGVLLLVDGGHHAAIEHGFTQSDDAEETFADLTAEWRRVILARREAAVR